MRLYSFARTCSAFAVPVLIVACVGNHSAQDNSQRHVPSLSGSENTGDIISDGANAGSRPILACWLALGDPTVEPIRFMFLDDGEVFCRTNHSDWQTPLMTGRLNAAELQQLKDRLDKIPINNLPRSRLLSLHCDEMRIFVVSNSKAFVLSYDEIARNTGSGFPLVLAWAELQELAKDCIPEVLRECDHEIHMPLELTNKEPGPIFYEESR